MDTCSVARICVSSFVCTGLDAGVVRRLNLPVAILRRSPAPHVERLAQAQRRESLALTITTFPPHGSLSVIDLRLSGHIIVFKMPVVDPIMHETHFLSLEYVPKRNMISGCSYRNTATGGVQNTV